MYCLLKRNAMLSLRLVLAALMGCLVLVCFAQPAAPIVSIEVVTEEDGDYVRLTWDAVDGAESYNIYSTTDPNLVDWGEAIATVGAEVTEYTTTETVDELGRAYFFYVTAYEAEIVVPERLVLVDGDLFNGTVTIDPFYISKYQVTQADFVDVMGEWNFHFPNNPTHPAEMVTWFDAVEYCNRLSIREGLTPVYSYNGDNNPDNWPAHADRDHLAITSDWEVDGYRLPTEAEWNHAANAGIHPPPYTYSGSNDVDEVAWNSGNAGGTTHPVGTKRPNRLGIYDMSGNVFEWCWDRYGGTFPSGGDNPRGDGTHATRRMRRGGSWERAAGGCTVSFRSRGPVTYRYSYVGFRVSRIIP